MIYSKTKTHNLIDDLTLIITHNFSLNERDEDEVSSNLLTSKSKAVEMRSNICVEGMSLEEYVNTTIDNTSSEIFKEKNRNRLGSRLAEDLGFMYRMMIKNFSAGGTVPLVLKRFKAEEVAKDFTLMYVITLLSENRFAPLIAILMAHAYKQAAWPCYVNLDKREVTMYKP